MTAISTASILVNSSKAQGTMQQKENSWQLFAESTLMGTLKLLSQNGAISCDRASLLPAKASKMNLTRAEPVPPRNGEGRPADSILLWDKENHLHWEAIPQLELLDFLLTQDPLLLESALPQCANLIPLQWGNLRLWGSQCTHRVLLRNRRWTNLDRLSVVGQARCDFLTKTNWWHH